LKEKKLSLKTIKCIIVIIGVIIIPLMYSYFYLGAFWDPYSHLESLPVAIVNNDKGAVVNDEQRNLGQEMCDRLKENGSLKFIFTDEKRAKSGTLGEKYYAMIVIPEDFSADIASASTTDKKAATITYSPNQKRNFLASQILNRAVLEVEETTRSSINKEITQQLADKLKEVPDKMTDLQDGVNKLNDGTQDLNDGAKKLADGTSKFDSKFTEYQNGVTKLQDGTTQLQNGVSSLNTGVDKLLNGADKITASTKDLNKLTDGATKLASGAKTFNAGLIQYTNGVDTLISSVNSTASFLNTYTTKLNPNIMKDPIFASFMNKLSDPSVSASIKKLQAASTQLKAASQQISDGAATLSSGTTNLPKLKAALVTLDNGLKSAKEGTAKLNSGADTLATGMATLNDATGKLGDASGKLSDGASKLYDGTGKLQDGVTKLKDGVDDSITDANDQVKSLDGMAAFAEKPVTIKETDFNKVPNYGTAFAPYFICLSLWVGALLIFFGIYLDADDKFKILSRSSENKVARSFIYLLIGFGQAVVLAIVLKFGLGLKIVDNALFLASCALISMVYISIVQFLLVHLKDLGKFFAIALLILQLTSCGGTFPMELVPKLFNVLYPYMPMTYSVALLKQAISGVNNGDVVFNMSVLAIMLVVFMAATILLSAIKIKKPIKKESTLIEESI
jgi:YhgE/Pip N-terminal domain/YhgE/Pip C-terminal domain